MAWLLLFIAGALETAWALALKESDGFTRVGATAAFVAALVASMVLLALALRDLPLGTGYAVWTGTGAVGAALAGIVFLGEPGDDRAYLRDGRRGRHQDHSPVTSQSSDE